MQSLAAALSIALILVMPPFAAAQTPATAPPAAARSQAGYLSTPAFASLVLGKRIRVTRPDGFRREGVVKSLSPTAMVLTFNDAETTLPFDQIARVEKAPNRMRNGTLIGLAAGVGFGVWAATAFCDGDSACTAGTAVGSSFLYGALGAAAGVGIGALVNNIKRNGDVIYDAKTGTKTTVSLAPILSAKRKGISFSVTWR